VAPRRRVNRVHARSGRNARFAPSRASRTRGVAGRTTAPLSAGKDWNGEIVLCSQTRISPSWLVLPVRL
jgi:hypothetical protein